ncbi:uncharacterized protein LOC134460953 [Engraulis encrasicolus]|uniref:uncharacterized protein LOC134460953 n=1 Tax=Engraulis encrasicolus TaxID=184585 RepID=UPI002FD4AAF8
MADSVPLSCVMLDRRKLLSLSPTKMSSSTPQVHWTQFASSSTKSKLQPNGTSSANHTQAPGPGGGLRELRLVLTDVLTTEIGRRYVGARGRSEPKPGQSERGRRPESQSEREGRRSRSQTPQRQPKQADVRKWIVNPDPDPHSEIATKAPHPSLAQTRPAEHRTHDRSQQQPKAADSLLLKAKHAPQKTPKDTRGQLGANSPHTPSRRPGRPKLAHTREDTQPKHTHGTQPKHRHTHSLETHARHKPAAGAHSAYTSPKPLSSSSSSSSSSYSRLKADTPRPPSYSPGTRHSDTPRPPISGSGFKFSSRGRRPGGLPHQASPKLGRPRSTHPQTPLQQGQPPWAASKRGRFSVGGGRGSSSSPRVAGTLSVPPPPLSSRGARPPTVPPPALSSMSGAQSPGVASLRLSFPGDGGPAVPPPHLSSPGAPGPPVVSMAGEGEGEGEVELELELDFDPPNLICLGEEESESDLPALFCPGEGESDSGEGEVDGVEANAERDLEEGVCRVIVGGPGEHLGLGLTPPSPPASAERHAHLTQDTRTHGTRIRDTADTQLQQAVMRKRQTRVNGGEERNGVMRRRRASAMEGGEWSCSSVERTDGGTRMEESVRRTSVLRLSGDLAEKQEPIKRLRLASPAHDRPMAAAEGRDLVRTSSRTSQSEPIVLSSEEEEEECDDEDDGGDEDGEASAAAVNGAEDADADTGTHGNEADEDDHDAAAVGVHGDDDDDGDEEDADEDYTDEDDADAHGHDGDEDEDTAAVADSDGVDAEEGGHGDGEDDADGDEEATAEVDGGVGEEEEETHTQHQSPHTHIMDMLPQDSHLPSIELPFYTLHVGGLTAQSSGKLEISDDLISIPLQDSMGKKCSFAMATPKLRAYSLLDAAELQELGAGGLAEQQELEPSGLAEPQAESPPTSVLLLWLCEAQAQQLHEDLSIFQPESPPVDASAGVSVCVCVVLQECVLRVEQALLASVMDIVGLRHHNAQLLSPLPPARALQALHAARDTHTLRLLRLQHTLPDTHTDTDAKTLTHTHAKTPPPSSPAAPATQEEPESIYSVEHSLHEGRYSVRQAKPAPEWLPYKHHGPARRLIQFPPPPCKGALTVTTEDLECLDSGQFLNDVIIDFYLKYLIVEKTPSQLAERCHVFSSFFYKQLTRRDNANEDSTSSTAEQRRHQRVKTWTRNVDIFSKDFLFIPVNQESHWYLVVVCFPGLEEPQHVAFDGPAVVRGAEQGHSGESQAPASAPEASTDAPASAETDKDTSAAVQLTSLSPPDCTEQTCTKSTVCKRPCILIMDSLKLSIHKRVVKLLREYLQVEWQVRRGSSGVFNWETMESSSCTLPLQDNSSDCGLYLLHYAETFLKDPVVHFELPLSLENWFPRQQVRRKRDQIRNLVLHLCRFQQPGVMGKAVQQPSIMGN